MKQALLLLAILGIAHPATATTIQGTPPVAPAAGSKFAIPPGAKSGPDDSAGLRRVTIEAVDARAGTFHVHGQTLSFDAKRVKVFGSGGKPASVSSLRKGSAVRFTLDPADPQHRRIAVIYVD